MSKFWDRLYNTARKHSFSNYFLISLSQVFFFRFLPFFGFPAGKTFQSLVIEDMLVRGSFSTW